MSKLPTNTIQEFIDDLPTQVFQKNEMIVPVNQVHKQFFYVEKGLLRVFYYDKKGKDNTHWFTAENEIVSILSSVYDQKQSIYGIQVLENDTVLRIATLPQFNEAKERSVDFRDLFEQTIVRAAIKVANRLIAIQTQTAKERYLELISEYPEIFQRANLGHIASYLGMTQQSLSRIRAEK